MMRRSKKEKEKEEGKKKRGKGKKGEEVLEIRGKKNEGEDGRRGSAEKTLRKKFSREKQGGKEDREEK